MKTKHTTILLIEDNKGDSLLFENYLSEIDSLNIVLSLADTFAKAIKQINENKFDIIFTDLNLPDSNGFDTLKSLIALNVNCPIIVITGINDRETGLQAIQLGAEDFLFKSELNSVLIEKTTLYAIKRYQLSKQLYESETRFRRMFEYSSIGIYRSSSAGQILEVNKAFADIFGYDSPQEVQNNVVDIANQLYVYPDLRYEIIRDFQQRGVMFKQVEVDFFKKDGSIFTGLLHMRRTNENTMDEFGVEGYVQDITKQKRDSKQLEHNLIFLRDLMDNIPNPVFAKDRNLRYTGCNKEFENYLGRPEKEILGKTILQIKDSELSKHLHQMDLDLLKTRKRQVFEHRVDFASGEQRNMIFYKNVISDQQGNATGIIGLMLDITDKKRALEQLQQELTLNEAMTELSKHLLKSDISINEISSLILNFCKSFTLSEHGYAGTIDAENDDLVLHTFTEMIQDGCMVEDQVFRFPCVDGEYPKLWGHALNTGEAFYTNEPAKHISSGGTPKGHIPLKNFLSVPVMINNKLSGQIALANSEKPYSTENLEDVKRLSHLYSLAIEKHNSIDELVKSKEIAEMSDKLKSAFLANMSHEIRTPLNAIVGFAQMLGEEGIGEEETRDFKNIIIKNTDLLLRLINDIIEMAMIEAGELKIHPENRPVNDTLNQIFESWKYKNEVIESADRIKFVFDPPEQKADLNFKIDHLRFNQIIDNLLMNAFRFTSMGEIKVGYRFLNQSQVEIFVKDTGVGISKEHQRTIFERFRQVDELKVRPFSGTGLGLAITKKLTEHLSGNISVDSNPGEGSTFHLRFPVSSDNIPIGKEKIFTPTKASDKEPSLISGKKLLIVEDNDSSYEFLEILLSKRGASVLRASTGTEAIEKAEKNNCDIILMDLQLPEISGFEAIRKIREKNIQTPIIVQTAFSEESEREQAFQAGCDAYLVKPITKRKLEDAILKFC